MIFKPRQKKSNTPRNVCKYSRSEFMLRLWHKWHIKSLNKGHHCIDMQTFPVKWTFARVTPIFKSNGTRDDENNYRPISVLPILSKVFEKHVCDHLQSFLKDNSILHQLQ